MIGNALRRSNILSSKRSTYLAVTFAALLLTGYFIRPGYFTRRSQLDVEQIVIHSPVGAELDSFNNSRKQGDTDEKTHIPVENNIDLPGEQNRGYDSTTTTPKPRPTTTDYSDLDEDVLSVAEQGDTQPTDGNEDRGKLLKQRDKQFLGFLEMKSKASKKTRKRLPGLIGIGVEKCGTQALACMLENHPMLKSPDFRIESHYFDKRYSQGINAYLDRLPFVTDYEIAMEKSPSYFRMAGIPQRIKKDVPNAKLYVVLCDPVNRTFSDFVHEIWTQKLPKTANYDHTVLSVEKYLEAGLQVFESNDTAAAHFLLSSVEQSFARSILTQGLYYYHLKRWYQTFNQSDILIINGEEIMTEPWKPVEKIQKLLQIPVFLTKENFVKNPETGFFSSRPLVAKTTTQGTTVEYGDRNCVKMYYKGRTRLGAWNRSTETYAVKTVRKFYQKYNEKLYALIGKRFNWQ